MLVGVILLAYVFKRGSLVLSVIHALSITQLSPKIQLRHQLVSVGPFLQSITTETLSHITKDEAAYTDSSAASCPPVARLAGAFSPPRPSRPPHPLYARLASHRLPDPRLRTTARAPAPSSLERRRATRAAEETSFHAGKGARDPSVDSIIIIIIPSSIYYFLVTKTKGQQPARTKALLGTRARARG